MGVTLLERPAKNLLLPVLLIEGIGPEFASDLARIGIFTVADLLRIDPSRLRAALDGRPALTVVRSWYHMATFLQIRAITPQWAEALVRAGLASCADLRSRDLPRLSKLFADAQRDNITPDSPDAATIAEIMKEAVVIEFTGALNGTIVDQDGKPVSGATVRIGREEETTDDRGRFRVIRIPFTAKSTLAISHSGCRPAALRLRTVESSIYFGSKTFKIRRLPAGHKAPKRILMEARGDVLPPVGGARIALREVERTALLQRDLLALTTFSTDKQRGKFVSKLLVYEDGEFFFPYVWIPLSEFADEPRSGDCFVVRSNTLVKTGMNFLKLRGWPTMIRGMRQLGPPPKDADGIEDWLKKFADLLGQMGTRRERL